MSVSVSLCVHVSGDRAREPGAGKMGEVKNAGLEEAGWGECHPDGQLWWCQWDSEDEEGSNSPLDPLGHLHLGLPLSLLPPLPLSQYLVHLGEHNLQRQDGCEQTRVATESFPHPGFNNSLPNKDHRNDIMLVKMKTPAFITRAVRPLTISAQCVTAGTRCLISGWGTTSSPQCRGPKGAHGHGWGGRREWGAFVMVGGG